MRWTLRALAVFLVAWTAYMLSPFVALYGLARAAAAHDLAGVAERVQAKGLRISLAKQIVAEYLRRHGRSLEPGGVGQNLAASAGASFADPIIAKLVTPEAVLGLLDAKLPAALGGAADGSFDGRAMLGGFRSVALTWLMSETRGFRMVLVPFPADRPRDEQFRLQLGLVGGSWKVTGIELPQPILRGLVDQLPDPSA